MVADAVRVLEPLPAYLHPAGIVLTAYAPSAHPEAWEMHGLTAVEQWSAGRIRGGVFYPVFSFARSAASPALPETSFLPEGEGVPARRLLAAARPWGKLSGGADALAVCSLMGLTPEQFAKGANK